MRVALHTLGCKLNQAETSAIAATFRAEGFSEVAFGREADVVVINSCTVTNEADRECRKLIRRALRRSPDAFVIVTGCYAQLRPEEVASIDGVDLVLGTLEKSRALDLAATHGQSSEGTFEKLAAPYVEVADVTGAVDLGPGFSHAADSRTRAFLKVQDGCDYTCSFCTIPLARGPSRSHPLEVALAQARQLVGQGFREIVLTGVNLGDYGRKSGSSFLELLERLHEVDGLERLKISSIEPNLLTEPIIDLLATSDRLVPHVHLPLQSGSATTLRRMRRRYRPALYAERCRRLVERIPDVAIGADVIVGFPGETEADVAATRDFLDDLPVAYLHVFTYSERAETPAAEMGGRVPRSERKRRTRALRRWSQRRWAEFGRRFVGTTRPVLVEQRADGGRLSGLTDNYLRVDLEGPDRWTGRIVDARLVDWDGARAVGEPLRACEPASPTDSPAETNRAAG